MTIKKRTFSLIFILLSAIFITIIISLDLNEMYMGFALIPILIAYQVGQYSERKFKN